MLYGFRWARGEIYGWPRPSSRVEHSWNVGCGNECMRSVECWLSAQGGVPKTAYFPIFTLSCMASWHGMKGGNRYTARAQDTLTCWDTTVGGEQAELIWPSLEGTDRSPLLSLAIAMWEIQSLMPSELCLPVVLFFPPVTLEMSQSSKGSHHTTLQSANTYNLTPDNR